MSQDLVPYSDPFEGDFLDKAITLAGKVSKTAFVPDVFRNKPEEVLAAILTGREVGLGPMQSLAKINVIKGKPTQSAELMRALVQSHGHEVWTEEYTTTRVILCGRRKGEDNVVRVGWTLDDAKRANLVNKDNWKQYPRAMLLARATGELCRLLFADVLGGISYTPEEIDDGLFEAPLELAPGDGDAAASPAPETHTRKAAPSKRAAAKKAAEPTVAPSAPTERPLPPLPGEDEPSAPETAQAADDPDVLERAQMVAMRCAEAGLDDEGRHHLIEAITNGTKSSARTIDHLEAADVMSAARAIAQGKKALLEGDDGWVLVDVEDATVDVETPAEESSADWSPDEWRRYLSVKGLKTVDVLREANRLCRENSELGAPPGSLGDLAGRVSLCGLLVSFVLDHANPNGDEE